jgi:DNA-binding protein HU-beta
MNKSQLIEAVASELGGSKAAAGRAVDAVIDCIKSGVSHNESVTISGFGTFVRKTRPARTGRNPSTGEPIHIKESVTVNFKPSSALRTNLNGTGGRGR